MSEKTGYIWGRESRPNEILVFRREFEADRVPDRAEAVIAAETRYSLWLNGREVVLDGGLFRESAPGRGWADCVDLAPYVKQGKNLLVIWVHYYGNGGRNNTRLPSGGLSFSCPVLGLFSGEGFLCRRHPAFYTPGEPRPSYLYGGDNLGYDARLDPDPGFLSAEGFEPAVPVDAAIFGEPLRRPIPLFRTGPEREIPQIQYENGEYRAVLPYAMNLRPVIWVNAKGGEKLDVRTDRWAVPGGPGDEEHCYYGHRLEFICKPGLNRLEGCIRLYGEKILVRCGPSAQIEKIGYRETGYDTDITGSFQCSDPIVNRLVEKAARTLSVCMRDNFMDCPDRERGQWIGDVSVQAPQTAFLLDERAMLLVKKAIRDFITLRKGDVLVGNVPGEDFSELPAQSLAAVSQWGLIAQYYRYTGDRDALRLAFEPAVRYLKLWGLEESGLAAHRDGSWPWYDHLYNCDGPVIENAWYLSALKFLREAADILNEHGEDAFLEERISSISQGFERCFWKGSYYASGDFVDDRANALAVLAGACPKERYPQIRKVLLGVFNSTVYMENFVLTALCEMGYIKEARDRMLSRYYNLAVNENSTLWEDFYILGTKNHAWSGAPAFIAFRYFMGVDIDAARGTMEIRPCWDLFRKMECRFRYQGRLVTAIADNDTKTCTILS